MGRFWLLNQICDPSDLLCRITYACLQKGFCFSDISVRTPQKCVAILIKKCNISVGSRYPKNIWFSFENKITCVQAGNSATERRIGHMMSQQYREKLFPNLKNAFLGWCDPRNIDFFIMKIITFRGDLTDISGKTKSLLLTRVTGVNRRRFDSIDRTVR